MGDNAETQITFDVRTSVHSNDPSTAMPGATPIPDATSVDSKNKA